VTSEGALVSLLGTAALAQAPGLMCLKTFAAITATFFALPVRSRA
jgi:hypothetical protein